jgi:hypothetical protein
VCCRYNFPFGRNPSLRVPGTLPSETIQRKNAVISFEPVAAIGGKKA